VAFGEHAAAVVGHRQSERAAVLELERDVGAYEVSRVGQAREPQRAFDAVHARNRQARQRHALIAVDAIRDRAQRAIPDPHGADTGVLFDELQAALLRLAARHCSSPSFNPAS
jgi:hypothetical protein